MSRISAILKSPMRLIKRYESQTQKDGTDWKYKVKKFAFNWSGYNKYGLYTDDLLDEDEPVVSEALRRLPEEVLDARNFRIIRAMQLYILRSYLPKKNWITYEQDREYRYLRLYMDEIIAERQEINEFGCSNYSEKDWPQGEIK